MGGRLDGWRGGWMDGSAGEWVDGWMGRRVDGWMGGWMDGWMDGGWWMVDGGWWMVDGGWWMACVCAREYARGRPGRTCRLNGAAISSPNNFIFGNNSKRNVKYFRLLV